VRESDEVKVEGWTYSPSSLRTADKILLVDDIFDTGKTINHLARIIMENGISRKDMKVVVHDYKYFFDKPVQFPVQPDYWCRKHNLSIKDEDIWIHYSSHELIGLSPDELEEHYYKEDPELRDVLKVMTQG
jgi:hypoxanthine phosphoribosyltransferase